jgi:putative membrane-bound dehydrogenase-like protein
MSCWLRRCLVLAVAACCPLSALGQSEHGFINTKPSGQPYLSPEESVKRLKVPPGYEVTVFAAEPDIINPIAFTVDERGRLWVVENFEYPKRTPKGKKPRDRIKILEDTKGTGKADKVTIWAEGKDLPISWDLASGIEVGDGGVYFGAAPYLFFLRDTKGKGKCDRQEVLLSGFGSQDTHETLNTFTWGPDGLLYGLHGIYTSSKVNGIQMNAAVWRYNPGAKKFDIFSEGTSNPWGLDFDPHGQAFLCACVIPHAYHMIGGGVYRRQSGQGFHKYAYGELKEICDHTHHKESGWAHAGMLVMQGDHVPPEYRGSLLMGSIHGCSIKRDTLERKGSTFVARHAPDFLVSGDKNFRPINLRWGPDGSIYVIDWHDQNPCHQAPADSWDTTHGRIYKIQRSGAKKTPAPDLGQKSSKELVELLGNNNPWWHRTALRLLRERGDRSVTQQLEKLALDSKEETLALRGLWGLYAVGAFDEKIAVRTLKHTSPWLRCWTVRLLGESGQVSDKMLQRLTDLALTEKAPEVRLQLASSAQRLTKQEVLPLLHNLMKHKEDAQDPCIPLLLWLAYEPRVGKNEAPASLDKPQAGRRYPVLEWLKVNAAGNKLVLDEIVPRTLRRLAATGNAADLSACLVFLEEVNDSTVRLRGLEGLVQALQNQEISAPAEWQRVHVALAKDSDANVRRLAQRLAVHFQDLAAIRRSLSLACDTKKALAERLDAIRDVARAHPQLARNVFLELLAKDSSAEIRSEACRALAGYDQAEIARQVLDGWKSYPPAVRIDAVNLLAGRKTWAKELLGAVGAKRIARTEVTNNTILRILALKDKKLNEQIEKVWGKFRDTPAELNALIDKMRGQLYEGRASFERGRKVFENQCAKCHKFEGKGHDVGPNLDGAARDIEYLLINILDPNRVVGQPYFTRIVELKNGRVETGLLAAEDDQSITLKTENDVLKVILKKDINGKVLVSEKSVMPEGLANNMTVQDFRDLIRYLMVHPFLTEVATVQLGGKSMPRIDPENPLSSKEVTWTRPVVGPPGRIPLPQAKGKSPSVAFLAAEVTAPAALKTTLQLGAAHPLKVWLNGKQVYAGKPSNGPAAPDQVSVEVALKAGMNRLLFEVSYQGSNEVLYARLLDPQRKLTYPEPAEK